MKDLQLILLGQGDGHSSQQIDSAHRLGSTIEGSEVRSRCVLKDFAATMRDDAFAPTPSPVSVRGLLLCEAWFDLLVETGDLVCAFMQADSSCEVFAGLSFLIHARADSSTARAVATKQGAR